MIVVLGDADDGTRLLQAIDVATSGITPPQVVVNDAIRDGAPGDPGVVGRVPRAPQRRRAGGHDDGRRRAGRVLHGQRHGLRQPDRPGRDPGRLRRSRRDQEEHGVGECRRPGVRRLRRLRRTARRGFSIDYSGYSGDVELSATTGERTRAWFEAFGFDEEGVDQRSTQPSRSSSIASDRHDEVLDVVEVADEEASELAVERAAAVEPQRVHDVLDDVEVVGEQRDAPLEVVEPGRGGDELQHATGELPSARTVLHHHVEALLERRRVPVGVRLAALAHRIEAERRLAFRRQLRVQPGGQHVLGEPLGVLADLGDRQVAVDDVEPGAAASPSAARAGRARPARAPSPPGRPCDRGSTP